MKILLPCIIATLMPSMAAGSWTNETTSNQKPSARLGAAAASVGGDMFIFAGCSSSCCYAPLSDVWKFTDGAWSEITTDSNKPSGRVYHSANSYKGRSYIFAGNNVINGFLNDLWQFDGRKFAQVEFEGKVIIPRRGAHSSVVSNDSLIVFGGRNDTDVLGDLWTYDFTSKRWHEVSSTSASPPARTSHAAAVASYGGDSVMIVTGGTDPLGQDLEDVWSLNLRTMQWTQLQDAPFGARHGHASWGEEGKLIVFGGQAGVLPSSPYLNDMYALLLKDKTWQRVTAAGVRPTPRALSSLARVQDDTLLFGGFSGYAGGLDDKLHNDLYSYES